MKTTIVIPTYNEAENLKKLVDALLEIPELSLLIVDDNSPDGTGEIADQLKESLNGRLDVMHRAGKQGLGTAYIQGFQYAMQHGAEAVGQMDADFSHPIDKLPVMMNLLPAYDFVLGSRYVPGGSLDESWPFWRKFLSGFGNVYARVILGMSIRDVTGGYRLWKRETLQGMPLERVRSNGYIFQVEMAYVASKLGYVCKETPIHFADRRWGKSKMSFRIQYEAAIRTWVLRRRYRDLKNKTALRKQ